MRLLLDTNALLWLFAGHPRITTVTRAIIADADEVLVSEASLFEISIKISIGKLRPLLGLSDAIQKVGYIRLQIHDNALRQLETLPTLHRDPFDRLLVAQAMVENALLVTSDGKLKEYGVQTITI